MSVYSPSQERFSIPEDIGTEAQATSSLSTSAVSDVQGAKHYLGESEFPSPAASSSSESSSNYFPSSTRAYSFSQPSIAQSPLMSPSTYPAAAFNPQAFPAAGSTDSVMTPGTMYPNGAACMSPSYMSPYGTAGKQYTWPTTPNAYGAFGTNAHDLMQSSYYQANPYSQMARSGYSSTYFPPSVPTSATHST